MEKLAFEYGMQSKEIRATLIACLDELQGSNNSLNDKLDLVNQLKFILEK